MNISSTQMKPNFTQQSHSKAPSAAKSELAAEPTESVSFSEAGPGETAAMIGLAGTAGAIGIGVPAALVLGSAKGFVTGNWALGIGLGAAAAITIPTLGLTGLGFAAMTTDAGSSLGLNSYLAGGAVTAAATGWAMFG